MRGGMKIGNKRGRKISVTKLWMDNKEYEADKERRGE